jgi:hypothetical protein
VFSGLEEKQKTVKNEFSLRPRRLATEARRRFSAELPHVASFAS